ncbi:PilZ domain-containing protein [Sphingomonas sp.]|uniref:PilZ domain-containing protein n=1 Tax=Sphingomonas sp. TaxID=28214 RepID=UPI002D0882E0|nr:PilZ domain-containing protein [Sphingomonas sp.]HWK34640.1 PilZ domain-containing protein [Sphingomonas sp.]
MYSPVEPVHFAAEYEPARLNPRRSPRAPVSLDAKVGRGGLDRALCKVINLSLHGARLQTFSALKTDSHIWLTLRGVGQVAARVAWANDFEAGCEFRTPLSLDSFEALVGA